MARYVALMLFFLTPAVAFADWNDRYGRDPRSYSYRNHNYRDNSYSHYGSGYNRYGYFGDPIDKGIRSGALSRGEARELREDQYNLRRKEIAYRRDGYLSKREREDLRDDTKDFRKELRHQLTDDERQRPLGWWRW